MLWGLTGECSSSKAALYMKQVLWFVGIIPSANTSSEGTLHCVYFLRLYKVAYSCALRNRYGFNVVLKQPICTHILLCGNSHT